MNTAARRALAGLSEVLSVVSGALGTASNAVYARAATPPAWQGPLPLDELAENLRRLRDCTPEWCALTRGDLAQAIDVLDAAHTEMTRRLYALVAPSGDDWVLVDLWADDGQAQLRVTAAGDGVAVHAPAYGGVRLSQDAVTKLCTALQDHLTGHARHDPASQPGAGGKGAR